MSWESREAGLLGVENTPWGRGGEPLRQDRFCLVISQLNIECDLNVSDCKLLM